MAPSDFKNADVDDIVEKLTQEEAILLTAGVGFWHTHAVDRLGIPALKTSDGPNGVRGNHFFMGTPAKCLPSATGMGATFNTELIEEVGLKLIARESKLRAASVLLAPTCNIQRNPLGGRAFESFSEDPYLSGMISAAYIKGVQSGGIAATIKHFVGNDKEDDRQASDSVLSERALREIYLMPFMLAQKHAKPWAFMTSYNRINGTHVSENPYILRDILRKEWGYEGLVMSDWFGVYSIDLSIKAGLDLEMPGLNKWRTLDLMNRTIQARKLTLRDVKARARRIVELAKKCAAGAPEILDGDGLERTVDSDEDRALMRKVAAESIVLLKNDEGILPLQPDKVKKIAIVGGNAKAFVLSGGGSAALKPSFYVSPYDGIVSALSGYKDVEISYSEGARAVLEMPSLDFDIFTGDGKRGWIGSWHAHESDTSMVPKDEPHETKFIDETRIFISDAYPKTITKRWTMKLKGYLKPRDKDCEFEFGLIVSGRAKLYVDGQLVIDNWTRQERGTAFFNCGSKEKRGVFAVKAGKKHEIFVEFCNVRAPAPGDEDEAVMDSNAAVRLGGAEVRNSDELMEEAVSLAKSADAVIAVVGLNADWETEGCDRTTMALPGRTDELVEKVAAANKKTVVVTQSGSSVVLPWADKVPAMVHAWYLGNTTGDAIADVLFGKINPSGKLSLSFPRREQDMAAYGYFHQENGKVRYAEDLHVGYKHHVLRDIPPLFAFGHGLSYTTFSLGNLRISEPTLDDKEISVTASVSVKNTGNVAGAEVVQAYISMPRTSYLTHPVIQLKAFKKVILTPGEEKNVELVLDKYAFSFWEERYATWTVEKGEYTVSIGTSSWNLGLKSKCNVEKGFEWNGL